MIKLHSRISLIAVPGTLVIGMLDNLTLGMSPWVQRRLWQACQYSRPSYTHCQW